MSSVEDLRKALLEKEKTSLQISLAMTVDGQTLLSPQEQWIRKKDVEAFLVELRKQLSERVLEIDEPSNDYSKVYQQNRQYRTLLKELLEASDSLSPKEIKDVAIARKELASGKCKTFKTADEMIVDLHKKHQELSGYLSSPREGIKKRKEAT